MKAALRLPVEEEWAVETANLTKMLHVLFLVVHNKACPCIQSVKLFSAESSDDLQNEWQGITPTHAMCVAVTHP